MATRVIIEVAFMMWNWQSFIFQNSFDQMENDFMFEKLARVVLMVLLAWI